jgi:hypothetical protein
LAGVDVSALPQSVAVALKLEAVKKMAQKGDGTPPPDDRETPLVHLLDCKYVSPPFEPLHHTEYMNALHCMSSKLPDHARFRARFLLQAWNTESNSWP